MYESSDPWYHCLMQLYIYYCITANDAIEKNAIISFDLIVVILIIYFVIMPNIVISLIV